ncbi:response regulator [bacterium]|nr:response regulator [bacterium]
MSTRDPEFAALAHDLSQLLWAIQGRARTLAAGEEGDRARALACIAEDAATAAAMLGGDDDGPCDLRATTEAAWRQAHDRLGHDPDAGPWRLDGPDEPVWVALPATALRRVLANLLGNALEAMPGGGRVTCRLERGPQVLVWTVADEGPGVPPALADRLFEAGATHGKAGGQGLGLAGSRALLRRLGADLVHRADGPGATFAVIVPRSLQARPPATPDPAGSPAAASAPARLLVVDDEATVRTMLAEMLAVDGHEVTLRADHDSALADFTAGTYDAVLIDLGLPGRSGRELARALRASDPDLALVMLTGWGRERDLDDLDADEADLTGVKPLDQPILRDLLARAVALTARRRTTAEA